MPGLDVLGKDQHADVGQFGLELDGCAQSLRGMRRRHPNVHDDDVGLQVANDVDQADRVAALADDVESAGAEQAGDALADERRVVDENSRAWQFGHDRGADAPAGLVIRSCPPSESTRSSEPFEAGSRYGFGPADAVVGDLDAQPAAREGSAYVNPLGAASAARRWSAPRPPRSRRRPRSYPGRPFARLYRQMHRNGGAFSQ